MYGDDPEVITDWCVLSAEFGHCFKRAGDHRFTRDGTSGCLCMLHHPCSSCIFVCSKDNGRNEPVKILQGMLPAIMFAFSSSSSVGTLPINMECVENMGASKEVSSFVLPLGATINMDGTAIYQGVCDLYCIMLWHPSDASADADDDPDCNAGFHRYCRSSGSRYGYARNGTCLSRTSG